MLLYQLYILISLINMQEDFPNIEKFIKAKKQGFLNYDGLTPEAILLKAAAAGNADKVREQLAQGVDINSKDARGYTALHKAAYSGHVVIAKLLVDSGADLEATTNHGLTPLHFATLKGQHAIVGYLTEADADVTAKTRADATATDAAVKNGDVAMVNYLMDAAEDINNRQGEQPLDVEITGAAEKIPEDDIS